MAVTFQKIQDAFDGIFGNVYATSLPWIVREPIYWFFKGPIRWWSRLNFVGLAATDRLTHRVADALLTNEEQRDRLTKGMYLPTKVSEGLGRLEHAYAVCRKAEAVEKKVRSAVKAKTLKKKSPTLLQDALNAGVITQAEYKLIAEAEMLRLDAIQVDDFDEEEYLSGHVKADNHPSTALRGVAGK